MILGLTREGPGIESEITAGVDIDVRLVGGSNHQARFQQKMTPGVSAVKDNARVGEMKDL